MLNTRNLAPFETDHDYCELFGYEVVLGLIDEIRKATNGNDVFRN